MCVMCEMMIGEKRGIHHYYMHKHAPAIAIQVTNDCPNGKSIYSQKSKSVQKRTTTAKEQGRRKRSLASLAATVMHRRTKKKVETTTESTTNETI